MYLRCSALALLTTCAIAQGAQQTPLDADLLHPQCGDSDCDGLLAVPFPKIPGHRKTVPATYKRRYSEVTMIGTHDAAAIRTADNNWSLAGNQYFNLTFQLDAGVRLIQAQGHMDPWGSPQIRLCHTNCALMDGGSLDERLAEVAAWLDRNPQEVVTFLFVNSGVPLDLWAQAYHDSGLDRVSYIPPPWKRRGRMRIEDWPTFEEMIAADQRVVTFLDSGTDESRVPWLLTEFHYMFENKYNNDYPSDFDCEIDRPRNMNLPFIPSRLSLVNHFLYAKLFGFRYPNATYANHTNSADFATGALGEHAAQCRTRYERRPNFLLVDFFNEGNVFDVEYGMNAN